MLAEHGFTGLTLRAVATEIGATTGLVTHYFPSKRDLVEYALQLLDERRAARPRLAALRAALLDILPLTPQAAASNRIWVSSWDAALADAELSYQHGLRYARSRERLRQHIQAAQRLGELPPSNPDSAAASIQSFALGLIVQALFAPAAFPPQT